MSINEAKHGEVGLFTCMIASGPVIIEKKDKVLKTLLVKHGDKPLAELKWKFPGGKVIKDSTLEGTAVREAMEEIGREVTLLSPLKPMLLWNEATDSAKENESEAPQATVLIHYLAKLTGEPVQGKEILAMQWFALDALPPDCSPNIAPVIEDYLRSKPL